MSVADNRFSAHSSACLPLNMSYTEVSCSLNSTLILNTLPSLCPDTRRAWERGSPPGWNTRSFCWWACRTLKLPGCLLAVPWLHTNHSPTYQRWSQERIFPYIWSQIRWGCFCLLLWFKAQFSPWMCLQKRSLQLLGPEMSARLLTTPAVSCASSGVGEAVMCCFLWIVTLWKKKCSSWFE